MSKSSLTPEKVIQSMSNRGIKFPVGNKIPEKITKAASIGISKERYILSERQQQIIDEL